MNRFLLMLAIPVLTIAATTLVAQEQPAEAGLYNPYERLKNGPPLTQIVHKAHRSWILAKLRNPKHHLSARMPDFKFSADEAMDVMAYLKSVAGEPPPSAVAWPAWADKSLDDLEDEQFDVVLDRMDRGKAVWGNARCSICHKITGPGSKLIGGFVDLRVGGMDLQIAGTKLKRDWLFAWIKDPARYFDQTLMPRYRFSDDDVQALVEYILRDDAFLPAEESPPEEPVEWQTLDDPERTARGKRLIELSRCVACHEIEGIADHYTEPAPALPADTNSFEFVVHDLRCLSCHAVDGRGGTYAPDLTGEGSRLHKDWIESFLALPDMIRPLSQQMPNLSVTTQEAQIVAAYISRDLRDARIPEQIPGEPISESDVQKGKEIYSAKGCVACHTVGEGPGGSVGPTLDHVAERLRPGYIWYHLKNPHDINPYSAEPDYGFTDEEARALAAYLATKKQ
jgi:mono/diheme cytochrome c family protein